MKSLPDKYRLLDTHCHLDLVQDPQAVISDIEREQVCTIAVTNAPFLFSHTEALCNQSQYLLPALGLHPELVHSHGKQINQFRTLLPKTRFIGEVGLDYVTNDTQNRTRQREVFEKIVRWSAEVGGKVLTVHSRRSASDIISIVGDRFPGTIILHWFSGSLRDLRRGLDLGFFFSVNPAMVRSEQGVRIIREIPMDRLLTETDSPFVSDGGVPVTPGATKSVCEAISDMWDCSADEVASTVCSNFLGVVSSMR